MDKDGSGSIAYDEFVRVLRTSGDVEAMKMTEKEISTMFSHIDVDASGQIQKEEFMLFLYQGERRQSQLMASRKIAVETNVQRALALANDKDVPLSMDQILLIQRKMRSSSYTYGGTDYTKYFKYLDKDKGGEIDLKEFTRMLRRGNLSKNRVSDREVRYLFRILDKDKDGSIDVNEFVAYLQAEGSVNMQNYIDRRNPAPRVIDEEEDDGDEDGTSAHARATRASKEALAANIESQDTVVKVLTALRELSQMRSTDDGYRADVCATTKDLKYRAPAEGDTGMNGVPTLLRPDFEVSFARKRLSTAAAVREAATQSDDLLALASRVEGDAGGETKTAGVSVQEDLLAKLQVRLQMSQLEKKLQEDANATLKIIDESIADEKDALLSEIEREFALKREMVDESTVKMLEVVA